MALPQRFRRRMAGYLKARMPELQLHKVPEVRHRRGRKLWALKCLLEAMLVGLCAGCKGLGELEELTDQMALPMRKMLGIARRLPDTTARDTVVRLPDSHLRPCMYAQVKAARRRKALEPWGLPFGACAIDGKVTAIGAWDQRYSQRQRHSEGGGASGLVRTLTCTLISSRAKVCLDAVPVPPTTNEAGALPLALAGLRGAYGPQMPFELLAADAAQCTRANATLIEDTYKLHYLLRLKDSQPTLHAEAQRLLGPRSKAVAVATTEEVTKPYVERRQLYITSEMAGFDDWTHLQTVLRVDRQKVKLDTGEVVHEGTRTFISSLPLEALSPEQWLYLVRCYWGVENQGHNCLDTAFAEDDRPWITAEPQGMVAILLLRRMAQNLMALFRCVTQRSDAQRSTPWKTLLRRLFIVLVAATDEDLDGLRTRRIAATID